MSKNLALIATGFLASTLVFSGCAPVQKIEESSLPVVTEETPPVEPTSEEPTEAPAPEPEAEPEATAVAPATQEETCDWDSPAIAANATGAPGGAGSDLPTAIVGAWQHTHIDTGAGFEPLLSGEDIRYVFPSASRILYCQDVSGATDQAQNAADFTLDGNTIKLPASSFEVTAWDDQSMVWVNSRDGSIYLLQRR